MVISCNKEITLMCKSGETLQVSQNLLEESSYYVSQVLSNSSSTVLLFPDVQFEELKALIVQVESGKALDENLSEIALKYGFKTENATTVETHLPLKKRSLENSPPSSPELVIPLKKRSLEHSTPSSPELVIPLKKRSLEHSPPSSPELVIDERYSPRKVSPSYPRSESPPSDDSLAPFLPWPLLLQQVAMQNSLKDLDKTSITEINSRKSTLFDPLEPSESYDSEELISCEECGKMFRASNLRIHMRRVHRVLQEPVKCCGQDFPTRWHLSQHRKSGDHLPTLWKTESVK